MQSISNMWLLNQWPCCFLLSLLLLAATSLGNGYVLTKQNGVTKNTSIPSLFIFGDSTVDSGNNNYIKTIFKCDFPPYGIDFPNQVPTGRFTDGRLTTDFIASYFGLNPTISAYLDPALNVEDLMVGISFASAGSGYDLVTSTRNSVISLSKQLLYFDEYKKKLQQKTGKKKMENIVDKAIYIVSAGTNDIIFTYGIMESPIPVPEYLHFLLGQCKRFIQGLKERGARKIAIVGLPPVGCLPAIITLHSILHQSRTCVESILSMARNYNQMLQDEIKALQASQPNYLLAYGDIYTPLYDQFHHPQKYGFEVVDRGCCGSGYVETSIACNSLTPICSNRSSYMFWDAIHPTESSHHFLFQSLRPVVDFYLHHL